MSAKNNIFEDFAKLSTNLASTFFESGKNISEGLRSKTQSFARSADLVTRDEFDVVKSMASRIRLENEALLKDVSEMKKNIQAMTSALDVLKAQAGGGSESNEKLMSDLREFGENIESKLSEFGDIIKSQAAEIERINSVLEKNNSEKQSSEKPLKPAKVKKVENQNPSLFDDEQN